MELRRTLGQGPGLGRGDGARQNQDLGEEIWARLHGVEEILWARRSGRGYLGEDLLGEAMAGRKTTRDFIFSMFLFGWARCFPRNLRDDM